jgi:DNA-binding transcriptional MerR regulator
MSSGRFLSPAEAAQRLNVSAKALRIYEHRGFIVPARSAAGWRVYGPAELARVREIIALRALGLSLAQINSVLEGDGMNLKEALTAHESVLEDRIGELASTIRRLREMKSELSRGKMPAVSTLADVLQTRPDIRAAFDLPWPWGGEHFEIRDVRALNYIVGPLGSGKTRLAQRLAQALPDAAFVGLERLEGGRAASRALLETDHALRSRLDQTVQWLVQDGAVICDALIALLVRLESERPAILIVDMIEHGLDHHTQDALIAWLRRRKSACRPLFLLTRSSAILDLAAVGSDESIIFCPANHSPPVHVAPHDGAPGYEAVASCLATPEVRARTEGTIAWRPEVAHPV